MSFTLVLNKTKVLHTRNAAEEKKKNVRAHDFFLETKISQDQIQPDGNFLLSPKLAAYRFVGLWAGTDMEIYRISSWFQFFFLEFVVGARKKRG